MTGFHHRSGPELADMLREMWLARERSGEAYALMRRGYLEAEAEARAEAKALTEAPEPPTELATFVSSVAEAMGFDSVPVVFDIAIGSSIAGFTDHAGVHLALDADRWSACHELAKWLDRQGGGHGGYSPGWADLYVRAVHLGIGELEGVLLRDAMVSRGLAVGEVEATEAGEEE